MKRPTSMVKLFGAISFVLFSFSAIANGQEVHDNHADTHHENHDETHADHHLVPAATFDTDYLIKHVVDAHDIHLFDMPAGDGLYSPVTIPLPVILFADGGFHMTMSSTFEHGHAPFNSGDIVFTMNDFGTISATKNGEVISMQDFSISKSVVAMLIVAILMFLIFGATAKFYRKNGSDAAPRGIAGFVEPLIIYVRDEIARPNIGDKKYMKFMPYLLTVFFFIWIANLLGLLPFGFNLTGTLMVTFTLAVFTFVLTTINGNKGYWGHIFAPPGVPVALLPIMIPIEVAGMFIKPAALMIRLFANMTAGHIVVMSLIGLIFSMKSIGWAGLSIPMTLFVLALELLVAALQAYVFTMLSALFIGMAVQEDHH